MISSYSEIQKVISDRKNYAKPEDEIIAGWKGCSEILLSISCITYNHEDYIEDAILGFLSQRTNFPFEVLIHDDASTDKTADIIRKYERQYPRLIKPIYQKVNQYSQGVVIQQINVPRAVGRYIAVCEGDDFWLSCTHLQEAFDKLSSDSSISIYGASCILLEGSRVESRIAASDRYSLDSYIRSNPYIATCSLVLPKSSLLEASTLPSVGGKYFAGDTRLKLIALCKGALFVNPNISVVYRYRNVGSWSSRVITKQVVLKELLDNLAIIREVASLNNYQDSEALLYRIEHLMLQKGLYLASQNGFRRWLRFVFYNLQILSPRYFKRAIASCPARKYFQRR